MNWYVIQTKPTAEESVKQHLKNANFETFLPKIRTMVRGSKRSSSRIRPLFPAYIFVHIDLKDANLYRMIKYTRGVRKILGDGAMPVPVPDEMIHIIKERTDGQDVIEQRITMNKGDEVRIRSGVFRDLVGILEKPVSAAGRVRILLKIMNNRIKCEMSAGDVEKV
ncbi:MAG: transcription termination/antitermination NusG family protein [Pseudomonadota bacterium]